MRCIRFLGVVAVLIAALLLGCFVGGYVVLSPFSSDPRFTFDAFTYSFRRPKLAALVEPGQPMAKAWANDIRTIPETSQTWQIAQLRAALGSVRYASDRAIWQRRDRYATVTEQAARCAMLGLKDLHGDCDKRAIFLANICVELGISYRFLVTREHAWIECFDGSRWWAVGSDGNPAAAPEASPIGLTIPNDQFRRLLVESGPVRIAWAHLRQPYPDDVPDPMLVSTHRIAFGVVVGLSAAIVAWCLLRRIEMLRPARRHSQTADLSGSLCRFALR